MLGDFEAQASNMYGLKDYMEEYKGCVQLQYRAAKVFGKVGYLMRLSKPEEPALSLTKTMKDRRSSNFEMQLDAETGKYQRKLFPNSKELLSLYKARDALNPHYRIVRANPSDAERSPRALVNRSSLLMKDQSLRQMQRELEDRMRFYASGVHTYQLANGEARRVRNNLIPITMEDDEANKKREAEMAQERNIEKVRFLNSRRQYKLSLKNQPIPDSIRNLIIVSIILFLTFIGLTIIMYCITESSLFLLRDIASLPWKKNVCTYHAYDGLFLSNSLSLLQSQVVEGFEDSQDPESRLRTQIHYSANKILKLITEINDLIDDFQEVMDDFIKRDSVAMVMYRSKNNIYSVKYTYIESVYVITSSLLEISSTANVDVNDLNLKFLRENLLNAFRNKDLALQASVYSALNSYTDKRERLCLIVTIVAVCFYLVACILLYPFLLKAHRTRENVLGFFLFIPTDAIVQLQDNCENYLARKNGNGKFKKDLETQGLAKEAEDFAEPAEKLTKRKTFLKIMSAEWSFFWYVLTVMLILDSYYILVMVYVSYVVDVVENFTGLIHSNSELDPTPLLVMASAQNYIINQHLANADTNAAHESPWDLAQVAEVIGSVTTQTEKILEVNTLSDWLYKKRHVEFFNEWMYDSVCANWESFNWFKTKSECDIFLSGILAQGYYNLMMEYVFMSEAFLNAHSTRTPSANFASQEWRNMWPVAKHIVHTKNALYMDYILSLMSRTTKDAQMIVLVVSLSYILVLAACFLVLWIPYVFTLKKEICRTNSMLLLIPVEVYLSNRQLRKSFENKLNSLGMNK